MTEECKDGTCAFNVNEIEPEVRQDILGVDKYKLGQINELIKLMKDITDDFHAVERLNNITTNRIEAFVRTFKSVLEKEL